MDANQLSKLDPKLKEVYDKVMNAPIEPRREQTINHPTPPAPPTSSSQNPVTQSGTSQVTINMPTPPPAATSTKTSVHGFVASEQKKSGKIPVIAYVLIAVLFFIAYAIFWLFFFKIPLPFISQ